MGTDKNGQRQKKNKVLLGIIIGAIVLAVSIPTAVYSYSSNQYNNLVSLGDKALESENFDEAEKYYKEALNRKNKNSSEIDEKLSMVNSIKEAKELYSEGEKLLADKNYLEAIDVFKKIKSVGRYGKDSQDKITQASRAYVEENLAKAKLEIDNKRYSEAIGFLDIILKFDETNKEALALKAEYNKELVGMTEKESDSKGTKVTGRSTSTSTGTAKGNTNSSSKNTNTSSAPNPAPVTVFSYGNTTGNIINGSGTAFDGEFIYFTNRSDADKIYKVKPDDSGLTKVTDSPGYSINIVGEWIYYSSGMYDMGIYKVKKDGSNKAKLVDGMIMSINVVGEWIYYTYPPEENGVGIYKIKVDGSNKTKISVNDNDLDTDDNLEMVVVGEWIYTNLLSKKEAKTLLCRIKIDGTKVERILDSGTRRLAISSDWLYYVRYNGAIEKMKVDGSNRATIYKPNKFEPSSINISGNKIFFSADNESASEREEHYGLYRIDMDGSGFTRLSKSWCRYFAISSNWIYFSAVDGERWRIKTDGTEEGKVSEKLVR
ncbi:DUF5050 domain-containing protein [Clostridium sp. UBA4548]|uniref:DUF5050 domain-containing protein n=1 Tax=Clostridium sp. UBA4548 TaxID=1946361 RepID=UPI0025BB178C|nr:DUF5050 domain-containing protein [Clostridium sp. UBA4548]